MRRSLPLLPIAFLAVWLTALPSSAATERARTLPTLTKFKIDGFAGEITEGADRNLWFTAGDAGNGYIGRITPSGKITEFRKGFTGSYGGPSILIAGPDGDIWFAERVSGTSSRIARLTTRGRVIPFRTRLSANGGIQDMTTGPDGNVWFTAVRYKGVGARGISIGLVGRITPTGKITTFSTGRISDPGGITSGPDGNVWFAGTGNHGRVSGLGSVTPTGDVSVYLASIDGSPADITTGPDDKLWFTGWGHIGRVDPATLDPSSGYQSTRTFSIGKPQGYIHAITVGPDKNVWFAAQNETGFGKIGWITPSGRVHRLPYRLGNSSGDFLDGIAVGADRNIWFTDNGRNGPSTIDRVKLHRG